MIDKIIEIVAEALEIEKDLLSQDTQKGEIEEWDSLGHLIVVSMIETEFNIKIPFEKVNEINRISDFLEYIK